MVKFFVPFTKDEKEMESVFQTLLKTVGCTSQDKRVYSVTYKHNGQTCVATVGEEVDELYQDSVPTVIGIIDTGPVYQVMTRDRGVARGEPIFVGKSETIYIDYFD